MSGHGDSGRFRRIATKTRRGFLRALGAGTAGVAAGAGTASSGPPGASETGRAAGVVGALTASSHEIDSCTRITNPGEYVLTDDITPETVDGTACIEIVASDVTLDGNGHTIDGSGAEFTSDQTPGAGVLANAGFYDDDGQRDAEHIAVRNFDVTGFPVGVGFFFTLHGQCSRVRAYDNVTSIEIKYGGAGNTVEDCTVTESRTGVQLFGDPHIWGGPNDTVIRHCDFESNGGGVWMSHEASFNTVTKNRFVGNGTGAGQALWSSDNEFDRNVFCDNRHYAIVNHDRPANEEFEEFTSVVPATENYWGAADGPSSFGDPAVPFRDPVTDRPADGDGDAVSEGLNPGVANVHFDPFLAEAPADAGVRD